MTYIESLWRDYRAKARAKALKAKGPVAHITASINAKGSLVVRCKRSPKMCTRDEFKELAKKTGLGQAAFWLELRKRKITVKEVAG